MDRFVAIAVSQGDAFFLARQDTSILVDGGRTKRGFADRFQAVIGQRSVDIAVCTHADLDHTSGILGLLEDDSFAVGQLWLPADWLDVVDQGGDLVAELRDGGIARLEDALSSDVTMFRDSDSSSALARAFELDPDDLARAAAPMTRQEFAVLAARTVDVMREIVDHADRRRIPIRWFQFDPKHQPCGGESELRPVNSYEVDRSRTPVSDYVVAFARTVSNVESLVFQSPDDGSCAVLFTSDSSWAFTQPVPLPDGVLVTASHHGSADAEPYCFSRFITDRAGGATWVRSDRPNRTRPAAWYLELRDRVGVPCYCTACRAAGPAGQDVRFDGSSGAWLVESGIVACSCT